MSKNAKHQVKIDIYCTVVMNFYVMCF